MKKTSNSTSTTYSMADFYSFNTANSCIYLVEESWLKITQSDEWWGHSQEALKRSYEICKILAKELHLGNYDGKQFPIVYRQHPDYTSKRLRDVIFCRGDCYLISDRTKILLEENNVTGWKTYPVIVYDKRGNEIKGYHGFSIIGHCGGKFDYLYDKKSTRIEGAYEGASIDLEQWDGSEIFTVGNYGVYCCITRRVFNLLKTYKIDGLGLQSLPKYIHFGSPTSPR